MSAARKIRSPEDYDRFRLALVPIDEAFFASETRWGVGRLERLVSLDTLNAYRRGWSSYRDALEAADGEALEAIGPKMIAALAFMDAEAEAAGHKPLAVESWEAPLGDDGTVLVLVRTQAEQSAVVRASNGKSFTGNPNGGMRVEPGTETSLPPDVMLTVRSQHEGRAIECWTLGEVAALILAYGSAARPSRKWEGTPAFTGRQMEEGAAADLVRQGHPLDEPIGADVKPAAKMALAF